MKAYAIITGGGTGIGRALALELAKQKDLTVLITGRTLKTLEETQHLAETAIEIVQADVSTEEGRNAVLKSIPHNARVAYLIHNAAIIEGNELKDISLDSWRHQMAVNVEAPLFLTQKLFPLLKNGRILHISSGFAHMPCHGLGAYCISKAALNMMYKCLSLELQEHNITVGSLRPGVVDTPFQDKMRTFPAEVFRNVPKFISMKEESVLQPPEKIAKFTQWVLLQTDNAKFSEDEWNIADTWHQKEWL